MKKIVSMLTGVVLGAGFVSAAFAGGHSFNQPMNSHQFNGGSNHGFNNGNNGGFNHGNGNHGNNSPIITDPKNPASTRNWAVPQAQSVYCIGAGCTLHYPTPQQQAASHGQLICNNSGCHY